MKIIICTAGAFALVLAACGGYTPIGEGEAMGGSSGTGGTSTGGTGGTSMMTGGTGGSSTGGSSTGGTATGGSSTGGTATGGTATGGTATGGTSMMTGGTGGTATGGTGGTGMYDPCANRACGTTCSVCDPNDPMCAADAVITYCDAGGNCTPSFPMCQPNECETWLDCPILDIACPMCSDGSTACPTSECVSGQCVTSYPTCPGQMCMTAAECPVSAAPCTMCKDGTTVCPWSDCVNGVCTGGIDSCSDTSPCEGKSCGDVCTPCVGSNCDAAAAPVVAASYCDENLDCVYNRPMCAATECKLDTDCVAPEICMACAGTGECATMKCLNGGCQWQCTNACGGCEMEEVCVQQIGGPGPGGFKCATIGGVCDVADQCTCIEGQGMCHLDAASGYCQCDNGLE